MFKNVMLPTHMKVREKRNGRFGAAETITACKIANVSLKKYNLIP